MLSNHDMASQSWEHNPDLSILPYDAPKNIKLEEQDTGSCPKCCWYLIFFHKFSIIYYQSWIYGISLRFGNLHTPFWSKCRCSWQYLHIYMFYPNFKGSEIDTISANISLQASHFFLFILLSNILKGYWVLSGIYKLLSINSLASLNITIWSHPLRCL